MDENEEFIDEDFIDDEDYEPETTRKPQKVEITIESGHYYDKSVNNGAEHVSVGFFGRSYGSGCPCDTEQDVERAVANCKEWIVREGDVPVVIDKRTDSKNNLLEWCK